jgi:hypothetical protein
MEYKILEAHIEYTGEQLSKVAVLVDCTNYFSDNPYTKRLSDIREFYATNKPCSGYTFLRKGAMLCDKLLQEVAAAGMTDEKKSSFKNSKYVR